MKKLIFAILALFLVVVGCDNNNTPTPEPPAPDTPDTIVAEYTGFEYLRTETIPYKLTGGGCFHMPTISIVDENGVNLLTEAPGNLRDNDFQFICDSITYRKGDVLPGFDKRNTIGYEIDYIAMFRPNALCLGFLKSNVKDGEETWHDMIFVWPEKNFKMNLRIYERGKDIELHEGNRFYREPGDKAFVHYCGMFVNGKLSAGGSENATLQLDSQGKVKILHPVQ